MDFPRTFNSMKEMQETNRTTILRAFFAHSPTSRSEIAEKTGLSLPTISRIVKELIQEKLVIEVGKIEGMQGRHPELLQLNYDHIYILGFEVNESNVHGVVCDLKGEVKMTVSDEVKSKRPEDIAGSIEGVIKYIRSEKEQFQNIIGIGLSISGIVSPGDQEVVYSNTMGWKGIHVLDLFPPLGDDLMVVVENDANAALLGELWLGNVPEDQNIVYMVIGAGVIGASLLVDGQLARGSSLMAGEISHFPVETNGKKCNCGNFGCLETYVSLERLQQDYRELSGNSTKVIEAYKSGDHIAIELVVEAAHKIATVILAITYLVNPEKVILGGLWLEAGDEFLNLIRAKVKQDFALDEKHIPQIVYSRLHPHAGVMGAVGLVINEFFKYQ